MKFFPTISELLEIIENLPPEWINKDIKKEELGEEEARELDSILEELCKQN